MAWLNSDDKYLPWVLNVVGMIFQKWPEIEWLTTSFPMAIDEYGNPIKIRTVHGFNRTGFLRGDNLVGAGWPSTCFIQQESTFWRRSLWERSGRTLDSDLKYAGDFELWIRFFDHAHLYAVELPLGCFRKHPAQKTSVALERYIEEAKAVFLRRSGKTPNPVVQKLRLR